MTEESKETTQVNQSETSNESQESKSQTLSDKFDGITLNDAMSGNVESDSSSEEVTDQGKKEISKSEEEANNSQSSEDVKEESKEVSSQSDNKVQTTEVEEQKVEQDQEKDQDSSRLSKLEKSYKSLEAEFTRRNQKSKQVEEQLVEKNEKIKQLEDTIRQLHGQTDKADEPEFIRKVKETNPDAARLLEEHAKFVESKLAKKFEEKFAQLQTEAARRQAQENLAIFSSKLDEFQKSIYAPLEEKLLAVIDERYPSNDELRNAVSNDPKLFDNLFEKFIVANRREVTQLEIDSESKKGSVKKESKADAKKREEEINRAKGISKSKSSDVKDTEEEISESTNPSKLSKKDLKRFIASKGLGPNDPFSNFV